ncbi:MGDG synthase family glycosyltransferase [Tumebacillus lipolyticus]|uniref:Glycosyltransferase n=1 Tax=Tumebacillus lipolyticus TaxID=1280370 RepID=A0ABW5A1M1_9BACL
MGQILLLSESIGAGHERAAQAVEEALRTLDPQRGVTRVNLLDTFRPRTAKALRTLYLQTLARGPKLWGKWYEWQREKEWNRVGRLIVREALCKEVGPWIRRLAPDAIICTHPLPACLIAELKRQGMQVPLITVLTDYDPHGYWLHPAVDLYCVPLPEIQERMNARLLGRSQVRATGIPVSQRFLEALTAVERGSERNRQVLLMGGGLGLGVLRMVEELVDGGLTDDLTVVCGFNQTLRRELKGRFGGLPNVKIRGYSQQVQSLMARSDLLVTKPGGMTVAEALVMRLPMVLCSAIPGQEHRNGELMSAYGVARRASSAEEGADLVRHLLTAESDRAQMIERIEEIRQPYAAFEVAEAALQLARRTERSTGLLQTNETGSWRYA